MEYVVLVLGLSFALAWWDAQRRAVNAKADAELSARIAALEAVNADARIAEIEKEIKTHGNHLESLRGRTPARKWG